MRWFGLTLSEEKVLFYEMLRLIYRTGADPVASLKALAADMRHGELAKAVRALAGELEAGSALSEAAARHPRLFEPSIAALLRSGEIAGELDEAIADGRDHVARREANRLQVMAALVYPVAVLALSLVPLLVFQVAFRRLNVLKGVAAASLGRLGTGWGVPWIASALPFVIIVVVAALLVFVLWCVFRHDRSVAADRMRMNLPVLGTLFRMENAARLCGILARLLRRGSTLPDALKVAAQGSGHPFLAQAMEATAAGVREGGTLSESLVPGSLFPPSFGWRIALGERGGKLAQALEQAGGYYERELAYLSERLARMAEPVAMLIVGLLIMAMAFVAVASAPVMNVFGMINSL